MRKGSSVTPGPYLGLRTIGTHHTGRMKGRHLQYKRLELCVLFKTPVQGIYSRYNKTQISVNSNNRSELKTLSYDLTKQVSIRNT